MRAAIAASLVLVFFILLVDSADARRRRQSADRRVDAGWESLTWCPMGAPEMLTFVADGDEAELSFAVPEGSTVQKIDNVFVVRAFDAPFFLEEDPACSRFFTVDFSDAPLVFFDRFDVEANGWILDEASLDGASAQRFFGGFDTSGGSIEIAPGGDATVRIRSLQAGTEYAVGFWWFGSDDAALLTGIDTLEPNTLFLQDSRFEVNATFTNFSDVTDVAPTVALTRDTGYFYFFNRDNVELVTKVIDACDFNDRYWVFTAGLTNVGVDIEVVDTFTGTSRTYNNPVGLDFAPILRTDAFATCAAAGRVREWEPNELPTPQNLDNEDWSTDFDPLIGDSTINTSTFIPHLTIAGRGDGTFDYYSFTVPAGGGRLIVDVDRGAEGGVDTLIKLRDIFGDLLQTNDDAPISFGQAGSSSSRDSYLEGLYPFGGVFILEVGAFPEGSPVPDGSTYLLNISAEGHP